MGLFPLKPSFAGGELTPALFGRTDLQKYDVGAAKLENAYVLRYGGASRRPGFRYVTPTHSNKKARLIPFSYSTDQNYVLEFTAGAIRIFTNGGIVIGGDGNPVVIATNYAENELATIKYVQSADVLFLAQPNHNPMTLTRYSTTDWRFIPMHIDGGPFDEPNRNDTLRISASATVWEITLTATEPFFTPEMVWQNIRLGHTIAGVYQHGIHTMQVDCVPHGTVYVETFGFWTGLVVVEKYDPSSGKWVALQTQSGNHTQNYTMKFTNDSDQITQYRVVPTNFNTDTWENENENQKGYVAIQTFSQDYYGIAKINGYISPTQVKAVVVRRLGSTEATNDFAISPWSASRGFPHCVGFFEDRLVFAGSKTKPQTYWASKSGDYFNFSTSTPQQDDDAITGTISGGQMNTIKALVTFSEMLMLTSGGEFKVGGGSEAFTPTNQKAKPQEYRGINDLTPVLVGGRVVYVQHQGSIVRDLTYSYDVDKYTGDDVSILAAHLFDGHKLVGITYQQTPNSIVWCVRDDGVLLGMTYIKEQDVYAWHQHTTQGKVVDVCSIPGQNEDELWAVILRGDRYFVEQMAPQIKSEKPEEQFFVDAGYIYKGVPTKTLSGLSWLAGKTVQILADGNVLPEQQVSSGGTITFRNAYSTVILGLGYETTIKTMPIEFDGRDGSWGSRKKRIAQMAIHFRDTRGGLFGVSDNALDEIKWRSTEAYNSPIQLYEGKRMIILPQASYSDTIYITIKQKDPLPMTILSIIPEVEAGG